MGISKFLKPLALATRVTISSSGISKRILVGAASTVLLATGILVLDSVNDASAAVCNRRTETQNDKNGGAYYTTWYQVSYCPNKAGAPIYFSPNFNTKIGNMVTTNSWFVCYVKGIYHAGGNNIWYYTQGDTVVSQYKGYRSWGYMPAQYVYTTKDPGDSKLPPCP